MIRIVGKNNCSACVMTKTVLGSRNIGFTYELIETLPQNEQDDLIAEATKQGKISMPIIIKDGLFYTLQEILKEA